MTSSKASLGSGTSTIFHHPLLTIHRKTLGHRWYMSNIITIANQQYTLILLTYSPLFGSLYKYTIETHIKKLKAQVQSHA